jgi:hypothetical protein
VNGNKDTNVHPDVKVEEIQAKDGNGFLDLGADAQAHGGVDTAAGRVKGEG